MAYALEDCNDRKVRLAIIHVVDLWVEASVEREERAVRRRKERLDKQCKGRNLVE